MARILTITLNPALDLTVRLRQLELGAVNRSEAVLTQAAGKGLNVAQVLADLGHRLTVSGFLGEDNQPPFTAMFQRRGFADAFVRVPGETRSNIKLAERGGRVSDLNGPGPEADERAQAALLERLDRLAGEHELAVVAGSLPRGVEPEWLGELLRRLRRLGLKVAFDSSGAALREGVKAAPWMIKPNVEELADLCSAPMDDLVAQRQAAERLRHDGVGQVVISQGAAGSTGSPPRVPGRRGRRRWKWPARWAPAIPCWPACCTAWPAAGRPSGCCVRPLPSPAWRWPSSSSASAIRSAWRGSKRASWCSHWSRRPEMKLAIVTACPGGQVTSVLAARLLRAPPSAWAGKPASRRMPGRGPRAN